jgi:hypothetical protein
MRIVSLLASATEIVCALACIIHQHEIVSRRSVGSEVRGRRRARLGSSKAQRA